MIAWYSKQAIIALWKAATPTAFWSGFETLDAPKEALEQVAVVYERVSHAICRTFQGYFILPWSGQGCAPASTAKKSEVVVTVSRSGDTKSTIIFANSSVTEVQTDASPNGAKEVFTGRSFLLDAPIVFMAGDNVQKSYTAKSKASLPGFEPMEHTLIKWRNIPPRLRGFQASIFQKNWRQFLHPGVQDDYADPALRGMYLAISSINNDQTIAVRDWSPLFETTFELRAQMSLSIATAVAFEEGEEITHVGTGAKGVVLAYQFPIVVIDRIEGLFPVDGSSVIGSKSLASSVLVDVQVGDSMTAIQTASVNPLFTSLSVLLQPTSGATGIFSHWAGNAAIVKQNAGVDFDLSGPVFAGAASIAPIIIAKDASAFMDLPKTILWNSLDWQEDLKLDPDNPDRPYGGSHGTLEAIARSRGLFRAFGELEEDFRLRVARLGEVVSPFAITRSLTKLMSQWGLKPCIREIGTPAYQGFFFDVPNTAAPGRVYAYDLPDDQYVWNVLVDHVHFRAHFLVGVAPLFKGEFGFAYDVDDQGAYDTSMLHNFYDGFPVGYANILGTIWSMIQQIKAGGVTAELYQEKEGCKL